MKFTNLILLGLLSMTFVLCSCSKYEEGPAISLLTKKTRVTGTWTPVKYTRDGEIEDYNNKERTIEFRKDGSYINRLFDDESIGDWEFDKNKTHLALSNPILTDFGEMKFGDYHKILRLTNDELWLVDGDLETQYKKLK